jgi:hypothetical protein
VWTATIDAHYPGTGWLRLGRDTIDIRWRNCTWVTGCARAAPMCRGDHSYDHAHGGETSQYNGNPLCDAHDREKTRNGWTQHRPDADTIVWRSPYGHEYRVEAEPFTTTTPTTTSRDPDPPDNDPDLPPF